MTREEAIKELKIFSGTTRIRLSANFWEALNTVIKALEQETFMNKPCVSAGVCEHDKIQMLEELRAEIEQITDTMGVSYNQYVSKIDVLQIIDKYKAECEDKE